MFSTLEREMIIKSIGCKTFRFKQLLEYFNKTPKTASYQKPIFHNLTTRTHHLGRLEAELVSNAQHIKRNKNTVVLFHDILSLHPKDGETATPQMLENLAYEYLSLRAKDALAYGRIETGKNGNLHCHLLIAGNITGSSKKLTLSKQEFDRVKRQLEQIQKTQYPELSHSIIFNQPRRTTIKKTIAESEREKRHRNEGRPAPATRKEQVRSIIQNCLTYATSEPDFIAKLELSGFRFYERGRKTAGVEDQRDQKRYRVSTLGLDPALTTARQQWERLTEALERFDNIEQQKFKSQVKELGFQADIEQILSIGIYDNLPVEIGESLKRIDQSQRTQRAQVREQIRDLDRDLDYGLSY